MALLMICSEHCVYVDLGEHKQLERFFPLDFDRIFFYFLPEMYSVRVQALRKVSRNFNASTGDGCVWVGVRHFSFKLST